jgi:hypothetical protein
VQASAFQTIMQTMTLPSRGGLGSESARFARERDEVAAVATVFAGGMWSVTRA